MIHNQVLQCALYMLYVSQVVTSDPVDGSGCSNSSMIFITLVAPLSGIYTYNIITNSYERSIYNKTFRFYRRGAYPWELAEYIGGKLEIIFSLDEDVANPINLLNNHAVDDMKNKTLVKIQSNTKPKMQISNFKVLPNPMINHMPFDIPKINFNRIPKFSDTNLQTQRGIPNRRPLVGISRDKLHKSLSSIPNLNYKSLDYSMGFAISKKKKKRKRRFKSPKKFKKAKIQQTDNPCLKKLCFHFMKGQNRIRKTPKKFGKKKTRHLYRLNDHGNYTLSVFEDSIQPNSSTTPSRKSSQNKTTLENQGKIPIINAVHNQPADNITDPSIFNSSSLPITARDYEERLSRRDMERLNSYDKLDLFVICPGRCFCNKFEITDLGICSGIYTPQKSNERPCPLGRQPESSPFKPIGLISTLQNMDDNYTFSYSQDTSPPTTSVPRLTEIAKDDFISDNYPIYASSNCTLEYSSDLQAWVVISMSKNNIIARSEDQAPCPELLPSHQIWYKVVKVEDEPCDKFVPCESLKVECVEA